MLADAAVDQLLSELLRAVVGFRVHSLMTIAAVTHAR